MMMDRGRWQGRELVVALAGALALAGCDKPLPGDDTTGTTAGPAGTGDAGHSGNVPGSSGAGTDPLPGTDTGLPGVTTGVDDCGSIDTGVDPWGDGCDPGLPTHSAYDVGSGGSCWLQSDWWSPACGEDEPCLDYDCNSPAICNPLTIGDCDPVPDPGGGTFGSGGHSETSGGTIETPIDDPEALECMMIALRDATPGRISVRECDLGTDDLRAYEILSNRLVLSTHWDLRPVNAMREQEIGLLNDAFDFADCVGPEVDVGHKLFCLGLVIGGCPVGPVACPP